MTPSSSKHLTRTLVAALALACCAVPAVAAAQPGPGDGPRAPGQHAEQQQRGPKAQRNRPRFPMEGARFVSLVTQRIERMKARIDRAIERLEVPPEVAARIRADFAKASAKILGAANQAAKNGTVTKQEAQKVRQLARHLRQQARQKYGKHARGNRGDGKGWRKDGPGRRGKPGQGRHGKPGRGPHGPPARS